MHVYCERWKSVITISTIAHRSLNSHTRGKVNQVENRAFQYFIKTSSKKTTCRHALETKEGELTSDNSNSNAFNVRIG